MNEFSFYITNYTWIIWLWIFNIIVTLAINAYIMNKSYKEILGIVRFFMRGISWCIILLDNALRESIIEYLPIYFIFLIIGVIISVVVLSLNYRRGFKKSLKAKNFI